MFYLFDMFWKIRKYKKNENQLFVYKMEKMLVVVVLNVVSSKVGVIEKKHFKQGSP